MALRPEPRATSAASAVSATIVIEQGGTRSGYAAPVVTISPDGTLSVLNNDAVAHTVTSVATGPSGLPLFDVRVEAGQSRIIPTATGLTAGEYPFYCRFHPNMRATLMVEGDGGTVTPTPPSFDQPLVLPPVIRSRHPRLALSGHRSRSSRPATRRRCGPTAAATRGRRSCARPVAATKVTFAHRLPPGGGVDVGAPARRPPLLGRRRPADVTPDPAGRERAPTTTHCATTVSRCPGRRSGTTTTAWTATGRNVWRGLQGMFLVTDPRERRPRAAAGAATTCR